MKTKNYTIALMSLMIVTVSSFSEPTYVAKGGESGNRSDIPIIVHSPHRASRKNTVIVSYDQHTHNLHLYFAVNFKQVEVIIYEDGFPVQKESLGDIEQGMFLVPFDSYNENSTMDIVVTSRNDVICQQSL